MIRPRGGQVVLVILLFCLVAEVIVWTTSGGSMMNEGLTEPTVPSSVIDVPAAHRIAPPDAVVNVKTAYGAAGNGRSDDTAPIQAAISAGLGFGNRNKVLYFPAGTYLVTKPLEWRLEDGSWLTWLTLMGQNRDRTVIKLANSTPAFADPSAPRAIVVTGSQNANTPDGSGNQAFYNFIFDLTIDIGTGNPGADGIDFLANNRGAIRNVVVRAAPQQRAHRYIYEPALARTGAPSGRPGRRLREGDLDRQLGVLGDSRKYPAVRGSGWSASRTRITYSPCAGCLAITPCRRSGTGSRVPRPGCSFSSIQPCQEACRLRWR